MASVTQWAAWSEEYYSGLQQIIDDAPFTYAKALLKTQGIDYIPTLANRFVEEAIKKGVIVESEPHSLLKKAFFAFCVGWKHNEGEVYSVDDAEADYKKPENKFLTLMAADEYFFSAMCLLYIPTVKACIYVFRNNPLLLKKILNNGEEISSFRLSRSELFESLHTMSALGRYRLLSEMKCPFAEEIIDSVQRNDFNAFKSLCYEKNIDLTEVAECLGFLNNTLGLIVYNIEDLAWDDAMAGKNTLESWTKPLFSMLKIPHEAAADLKGLFVMDTEDMKEMFPIVQTSEDSLALSSLSGLMVFIYLYVEQMEEEEKAIIGRLLENADFTNLCKLSFCFFAGLFDRFPENIHNPLTTEEQEEILQMITEGESAIQSNGDGNNQLSDENQATPNNYSTKPAADRGEEQKLHWPTDEELEGYKDNYNGKEYFSDTIFGPAGKVKASVIKELYDVLSEEGILKEDIETQLIFLARYTGKEIPGITLRPIEWHMLNDDREGAIGYLIYMTTTTHEFVKGESFFYFDFNGVKKSPDRSQIGQIGTRWAKRPEKSTARTRFETALNKFLQEYQSRSED